jgi:imidazolonepropionase-like amidohydrolase
MSEAEAIAAATGVAARTVPADDVGHLDVGAHADFLAVAEDPLADVSALREPDAVYRGGEPVGL